MSDARPRHVAPSSRRMPDTEASMEWLTPEQDFVRACLASCTQCSRVCQQHARDGLELGSLYAAMLPNC